MKLRSKNKSFAGSSTERLLYGFLAFVALILVWYLISLNERIGLFFPSPFEVIRRFFLAFVQPIGRDTMIVHIWYSFRRVMTGFLLGVIIGIPLGLIMACSRTLRAFFMPLFSIIRPIPGLAWIPLAILWFGLGESSKYFLICMTALVVITTQAYTGALNADPLLIGAGKMLGANSFQMFTNVILPSAVPNIFTGLQGSFSGAWCAVIAAEMIRSDEGLGWIIFNGMNYANTTQVLVGMLAIGIVGLITSALLKALERRVCRWNERGR